MSHFFIIKLNWNWDWESSRVPMWIYRVGAVSDAANQSEPRIARGKPSVGTVSLSLAGCNYPNVEEDEDEDLTRASERASKQGVMLRSHLGKLSNYTTLTFFRLDWRGKHLRSVKSGPRTELNLDFAPNREAGNPGDLGTLGLKVAT
ncbi:hypothetical protein NEUTE2DRAFT_67688 [Neurospora tetrasperma FGSC 2509]|nr:hypothetical protein NEUTE2DRAFT_67688 [Neurospora tetrasperma FGSC 2509]